MKWNSPPTVKTKVTPLSSGAIRRQDIYYGSEWDADRAVSEALDRVTWVYRCVDAIASNQMRLPLRIREDDRYKGKYIETHPLYSVFNSMANVGEPATYFRYRLSAQLLLSSKGVFIQVVRTNGGDVSDLILLNPDRINPIPDRKTFVSGYEYTYDEDNYTKRKTFPPEEIIWVRRPHPFNPYGALTPLSAAGLAIEVDWLAKLYNRNFLVNDGRPGGVIIVKGAIDDADVEELRARFSGGVGKAGRITVISSDMGADFVDTAVTPRDAQYQETRAQTKDEILLAFGVPESVLANASGRTFDNAEQERLIFWQETMRPHCEFISAALDALDEDKTLYTSFDISSVDVLQRMEIKRREYALREFDGGATTVNEYRDDTGREPLGGDEGDVLFLPKTKYPYAHVNGNEIPPGAFAPMPQPAGGRPAGKPVGENPEGDPRVQEGDNRQSPQQNTPNSAPAAQLSDPTPLNTKSIDTTEAFKTVDRLEQITKREIERASERMSRVLSEKISGRKFRKAFFDGDDAVEVLFDRDVWTKQLSDDLLTCQKSAFSEGYASVTGKQKTDFSATRLASYHVRTIVDEFKNAARTVVEGMKDGPDFRAATTNIVDAIETAGKTMSDVPVAALIKEAYNKGIIEGCRETGTKKVWVQPGAENHMKELNSDELYVVGKTSHKFPPAYMNDAILVSVLQK